MRARYDAELPPFNFIVLYPGRPVISVPEKRGLLEGGFCKIVRLSGLWRSDCQMYYWAQYPWLFFVSFGPTLRLRPPCESPHSGNTLLGVRGVKKRGGDKFLPRVGGGGVSEHEPPLVLLP